ncbi:hypothetical protein ACFZDF_08980 [Streptomyces sp. NPDC007910]|uniref:hypothetical protein n=1 Tax=Streptomyces sp. NPDC007910 TaxID=3364790 RepID=UPI0036EEF33E
MDAVEGFVVPARLGEPAAEDEERAGQFGPAPLDALRRESAPDPHRFPGRPEPLLVPAEGAEAQRLPLQRDAQAREVLPGEPPVHLGGLSQDVHRLRHAARFRREQRAEPHEGVAESGKVPAGVGAYGAPEGGDGPPQLVGRRPPPPVSPAPP